MLYFKLTIIALLLVSCAGEAKSPEQIKEDKAVKKLVLASGLSKDQIKMGVGPIRSKMELGPIDNKIAFKGKEIFDNKCVACHKIDTKLTAPSVRYVTERRSPEFIMNMMLNPDEMINKHPIVKDLLGKYYIKMTFQNVTEEDSRAMLEYFRMLAKEGKDKSIPASNEVFPTIEELAGN